MNMEQTVGLLHLKIEHVYNPWIVVLCLYTDVMLSCINFDLWSQDDTLARKSIVINRRIGNPTGLNIRLPQIRFIASQTHLKIINQIFLRTHYSSSPPPN